MIRADGDRRPRARRMTWRGSPTRRCSRWSRPPTTMRWPRCTTASAASRTGSPCGSCATRRSRKTLSRRPSSASGERRPLPRGTREGEHLDPDARPPPRRRPRPPRGHPPRRAARARARARRADDDRGRGIARFPPQARPGGALATAGRAARGARARLLRWPHPERARRTPRPAARDDQEPDVHRPLAAARPARPGRARTLVPVRSGARMSAIAESLKGRSFTRVADWSRDELESVLDFADDLKQRQSRHEEHHLLPGRTLGDDLPEALDAHPRLVRGRDDPARRARALPRRRRPPARPRRDAEGHRDGALALRRRDHDPHLRPGRRRGARPSRLDPGDQWPDRPRTRARRSPT